MHLHTRVQEDPGIFTYMYVYMYMYVLVYISY